MYTPRDTCMSLHKHSNHCLRKFEVNLYFQAPLLILRSFVTTQTGVSTDLLEVELPQKTLIRPYAHTSSMHLQSSVVEFWDQLNGTIYQQLGLQVRTCVVFIEMQETKTTNHLILK